MFIKVMNRYSIAEYKEIFPHIIISIGDPNDSEPAPICKQPTCRGILRLQFHDWDDKQRIVLERSSSPEAKQYVFYSEQQARQVVEFVREHAHLVEVIICQCDAGISRSAGMAAALSKILNGSDEYFFKTYVPNSRVYRLTLNRWMFEMEKK